MTGSEWTSPEWLAAMSQEQLEIAQLRSAIGLALDALDGALDVAAVTGTARLLRDVLLARTSAERAEHVAAFLAGQTYRP